MASHTVPMNRVPRTERILAACLGAGCLAVLILAAWLSPSEDGHGTHTQIGLNDCTWVVLFNTPCMTCGMTTAFAHAADADFVAAAKVQPMGAALSIATGAMFWITLLVATTGSTLGRACARLLNKRVLLMLLVLGLAAWAYKIITWS